MKILKSFILKESKEELRIFIVNFLALACLCIAQQYLVLSRYKKIFDSLEYNNLDYMTQMINMSLMTLSIICITFMSNATMTRSIQKEKKNGSIIILLALGLESKSIWNCKTVLSYITGYIAYILILILDFIMQKFIFGFPIIFSIDSVLAFVILGPLVAYSLVLILSFLFWYFNNNSLVTLIYTMVFTFGIWILMNIISSPIQYKNIFFIFGVIAVPLILKYIISKIINKQEKWKLQ